VKVFQESDDLLLISEHGSDRRARGARRAGADILITGEAKYNDYFDCEGAPILATVGHYESEHIATRLFAQIISQKMPNFAVYQSELDSNPIKALQHP